MPSIASKICLVTPVASAGVGVGSAPGAGAGVVALPSVTETASDSFDSADSPASTSVVGGGGLCDAILVSSIIRDAVVDANCWLGLVLDNTRRVRDLQLERVLFSTLVVYITCFTCGLFRKAISLATSITGDVDPRRLFVGLITHSL